MHKFKEILKSFEKKVNLWVILLLLVLGTVLSALMPPLQSPDEFNHVVRSYLLTKGQILLRSPQGQPAGGNVDEGLVSYFDHFRRLRRHPDNKTSKEKEDAASKINWSGKQVFHAIPNTAYYFPVMG